MRCMSLAPRGGLRPGAPALPEFDAESCCLHLASLRDRLAAGATTTESKTKTLQGIARIEVWRFRNRGNNHLGDELGTNSDAELAGVKITRLMPFGGLRSTRVAIKDVLGAPKWAPRWPQRATAPIEKTPVTVMLEPQGTPEVSD